MAGENQHTKARAEEIAQILSRVSAMEANYESVSADVHNIAKSLEVFASETRSAIKDLADRISDGSRTPWGVLFAGLAVLLTVISMVGGLVAYGIQTDIKHTRESLHQEIDLKTSPHEARITIMEAQTADRWTRSQQERYTDKLDRIMLRLDERLRALECRPCGVKKE
jgi:hypothetical protein